VKHPNVSGADPLGRNRKVNMPNTFQQIIITPLSFSRMGKRFNLFIATVCLAGIIYAQPVHTHRQNNIATDTLLFHGKQLIVKEASLPTELRRRIQFKKAHNIPFSASDVQEVKKVIAASNNQHTAFAPKGLSKTSASSATRYFPSIIVIDDTTRSSYTYDTNGKQLTELYEIIINNKWTNTYRYTYTYNNKGNQLTFLEEQYDNGAWDIADKDSTTYDSNGNALESSSIIYSRGVFSVGYGSTITYDAHGNQLTHLYKIDTNGTWTNSSRDTYTYDANSNLLIVLDENYTNGAWVYSSRYTYTYNSSGKQLTDQSEYYTNDTWSIQWQDSSTYDSNGNELMRTSLYYSNGTLTNEYRYINSFDSRNEETISVFEYLVNGVLQLSQRDAYTYDNNEHLLTDTNYAYTNGGWVISELNNQTKDTYGNTLTTLREYFKSDSLYEAIRNIYTYNSINEELTENESSFFDSVWTNDYSITYTYDEYGNAIHGRFSILSSSFQIITYIDYTDGGESTLYNVGWLTMFYDGGASSMFCSGNSVDVSYISITGVQSTNGNAYTFSLSQNYPNPFNPATTISFYLPSKSFVSLKIFDLLGRDIATIISEEMPAGGYSRQWIASKMTSGIYFYRLQAGSYSETKKLILLK
jgi:hypothetical protein